MSRQVGQRFQNHPLGSLGHLVDVPLMVGGVRAGVYAAFAGLFGPSGDPFVLHQSVVILVGCHSGEFVGRSANGEGVQPVRVFVGELKRDGPAHCLADQVNLFQAKLVQQAQQIGAEIAQRPFVAFRREAGAAEAPGIQPHHPVLAGQQRHPGVPQTGAFRVAVMQDDSFWIAPRVGVIVVLVVHLQAFIQLRRWHLPPLLNF